MSNQSTARTDRQQTPPIISARSGKTLPGYLITDILLKLPVKSLIRFRCVCKPFLSLLLNPKFIADHLKQTSQNPNNTSLVVEYIGTKFDTVNILFPLIVNIFRIDSVTTPFVPLHPNCRRFHGFDFVACMNGVLCFCKPVKDQLAWWNPATRGLKLVDYPVVKFGNNDHFSGGFGYDEIEDDYKFVRIERFEDEEKRFRTKVEVYSVNKDSWKEVQVPFTFRVTHEKCNATVNGMPYFGAIVGEGYGERSAVLGFDVRGEVFRELPMKEFDMNEKTLVALGDFRGLLAMIIYGPKTNKMVEIYGLDEKVCKWEKMLCVGPISLKVKVLVGCLRDGQIVVEDKEGKVHLIDHKTNQVKNLPLDQSRASYRVASYSESLVSIKGMERIGSKIEKEPPPRNDVIAKLFRDMFKDK